MAADSLSAESESARVPLGFGGGTVGTTHDETLDVSGHSEVFSNPGAETAASGDPRGREFSRLDWLALIAVVAGGLNCGLIAAVNLDVFAKVLPYTVATRVVQGLIGLAALHCVVLLFRLAEAPD